MMCYQNDTYMKVLSLRAVSVSCNHIIHLHIGLMEDEIISIKIVKPKCSASFLTDFGAVVIPNENTSIPFIRVWRRHICFPSISSNSKLLVVNGLRAPPSGVIIASKPLPSVPKWNWKPSAPSNTQQLLLFLHDQTEDHVLIS